MKQSSSNDGADDVNQNGNEENDRKKDDDKGGAEQPADASTSAGSGAVDDKLNNAASANSRSSENTGPAGEPEQSADEQSTPSRKRASPRRASMRVLLKPGCRILAPRDDEGCVRATVIGIREGGTAMVVHDDLYWVGYRTDDLVSLLRKGEVVHLPEERDVHPQQRVAFLLSPKAGQPPDCFLIGELPLEHASWRLFLEVKPAPKNGMFGRRYSEPRINQELSTGMKVTVSGRVTPLKRSSEKTPPITTESYGIFIGVVDAILPSQHCFWALVQFGESIHVASLFGKDGEAHLHVVGEGERVPVDEVGKMVDSARVSEPALLVLTKLTGCLCGCVIGCPEQGSVASPSEFGTGHQEARRASEQQHLGAEHR